MLRVGDGQRVLNVFFLSLGRGGILLGVTFPTGGVSVARFAGLVRGKCVVGGRVVGSFLLWFVFASMDCGVGQVMTSNSCFAGAAILCP